MHFANTKSAYSFEVNKKATKDQVRLAVEKAFKVGVTKVNIVSVPGETKRMGKREVASPSWKKAVVTLREGDKIQFFEGV